MNYAGHHNVPLTEYDWRVLAYPKSEYTREQVMQIRRGDFRADIPWLIAEDPENWYLFMDVRDLSPKYSKPLGELNRKMHNGEISIPEHARLTNLLRLEMAADARHRQILDSVGR